jgi:hypothetical protein
VLLPDNKDETPSQISVLSAFTEGACINFEIGEVAEHPLFSHLY